MWALPVDRVDFLRGTILVNQSLAEVGGHLTPGPTKTRSTRLVKVPKFITELLAEQVATFPSAQGHLFTSPCGGLVRHRNFNRRHWAAATEAAGLPGVRWHDLRHTCAAILIAKGWSMEQVKKHLGHSSIRVTSDNYGHLFDGHDDELLKRPRRRVATDPVEAVCGLSVA